MPENARNFYEPIVEWMKLYAENPAPLTTLIVKLNYLNTSSLSNFYQLFNVLKDRLPHGSFKVIWYHLSGDVDMKELGEDFEDALGLDMKIIEVETV